MGFPGGSAVKNPPANAGDTGSTPDPERSHMEQLSPCATMTSEPAPKAWEPQLQKPGHPRARAPPPEKHRNEKRAHHTWKSSPFAMKRKAHTAMKTQDSHEYINKI